MPDMKRIAALIIAKSKPKEDSYDDDSDDDEHEGKVAAAEEFIKAVKDGDAEGVAESFKAMYELCVESKELEEG